MRLNYLKEHREELHCELLLAGSLRNHLLTINAQAKIQIDELVEKMLRERPAPDKRIDQMGWIQHINTLHSLAEEIVFKEIIFI